MSSLTLHIHIFVGYLTLSVFVISQLPQKLKLLGEGMFICDDIQYIYYLPPVIGSLWHASIYLMLIVQVKNLPLTRPNCGKDVRHFEFEFVSHVSYPLSSLTLLYLYIGV